VVGFYSIHNILNLARHNNIPGSSLTFVLCLTKKKKGLLLSGKLIGGGSGSLSNIFNLLSGWDKRASMVANADPSLILVLLIALILIVVFMAIFTVRHRWEINEQRYRELLAKREKE
jgi:hypothetical protein